MKIQKIHKILLVSSCVFYAGAIVLQILIFPALPRLGASSSRLGTNARVLSEFYAANHRLPASLAEVKTFCASRNRADMPYRDSCFLQHHYPGLGSYTVTINGFYPATIGPWGLLDLFCIVKTPLICDFTPANLDDESRIIMTFCIPLEREQYVVTGKLKNGVFFSHRLSTTEFERRLKAQNIAIPPSTVCHWRVKPILVFLLPAVACAVSTLIVRIGKRRVPPAPEDARG